MFQRELHCGWRFSSLIEHLLSIWDTQGLTCSNAHCYKRITQSSQKFYFLFNLYTFKRHLKTHYNRDFNIKNYHLLALYVCPLPAYVCASHKGFISPEARKGFQIPLTDACVSLYGFQELNLVL